MFYFFTLFLFHTIWLGFVVAYVKLIITRNEYCGFVKKGLQEAGHNISAATIIQLKVSRLAINRINEKQTSVE